ncbi:MAG: hypothetical protein OXC64_04455 [Flavobacteriaceae bacterium]|nr:hypothetical protein [Flavobacteriaceae bacterium]
MDIWDAIEDKFQKQARFVRIPDIAITHPYDQEWILKNKELFYSNGSM